MAVLTETHIYIISWAMIVGPFVALPIAIGLLSGHYDPWFMIATPGLATCIFEVGRFLFRYLE